VTYLHHDQQGSTRLLTGSTGKVEGKCTYAAYGTAMCEGSVTTPLGYDGQYANSDTGLIYLRARYYDPVTGQFMSIDPDVEATQSPYGYAIDNPVNESDPSGECTAVATRVPGDVPPLATRQECEKKLGEAKGKVNLIKSRVKDLIEDKKSCP